MGHTSGELNIAGSARKESLNSAECRKNNFQHISVKYHALRSVKNILFDIYNSK